TDDTRLRGEIGTWIDEQINEQSDTQSDTQSAGRTNPNRRVDSDRRADLIVFMQFALLVTVLQNRIDILLRSWKQVEPYLQLEGLSSMLFHRPPDDYLGVIPVAPMGNVLGFQNGTSSSDPETAPDLRFFRCMGVGRWLMLHFPSVFADNGAVGPLAPGQRSAMARADL
ncbi:MAG: hypothetical protein ACPL8I_04480, partial [Chloroflexaceae bacterium]